MIILARQSAPKPDAPLARQLPPVALTQLPFAVAVGSALVGWASCFEMTRPGTPEMAARLNAAINHAILSGDNIIAALEAPTPTRQFRVTIRDVLTITVPSAHLAEQSCQRINDAFRQWRSTLITRFL
jgi:hypothetical protein